MRRWLATMAMAMAACAEDVDHPLPDYTAWGPPDVVCGYAPGHGNSCRMIYVNAIARGAWNDELGPGYPLGSEIVKEIRANNDGEPGDLSYIAAMYRTVEITASHEAEGGWLFAQYETPDAGGVYRSLCWGRCHAAAPFNGAFYDYRDR